MQYYSPDRVVTTSISDPCGVAVFSDVAVYVLHQQVGREHTGYKISTDIAIIKVILKERWDLDASDIVSGCNTPCRAHGDMKT